MSAMGKTSVASNVRSRVRRSHDRFWRPEDFDGSPEAVAKALSRLSESGELRRIRRGLYWRGSLDEAGDGSSEGEQTRGCDCRRGGHGSGRVERRIEAWVSLRRCPESRRSRCRGVPHAQRPVFGLSVAPVPRGDATSVSTRSRSRCWRCSVTGIARSKRRRRWLSTAIGNFSDAGAIRLERVVRASSTEPASVRERLRSSVARFGQTR